MPEEKLSKVGYYTIYKIIINKKVSYRVDSGKTLFVKRFNKIIPNPYRDIKTFTTLTSAKKYIKSKLSSQKIKKDKVLKKLPKSLYLVLIKEEVSNRTFVKVGITSKKLIQSRFSKSYGYEG